VDAEKFQCAKCGQEAKISRRDVRYAQLQLPYQGAVRVPEVIALEVDCPQCGTYAQVMPVSNLARGGDSSTT